MPMRHPGARRVELRSALIGAAAALLAAILGGVVAGIPVLIATNAQITASSQEAGVGFLREERKAAYADLLAKSDAYRESAATLVRITPGGPQGEFSASQVRWTEAQQALLSSVNNVKLVATREVSTVADQLILHCNDYDSTITDLAASVRMSPGADSIVVGSPLSNAYDVVYQRGETYGRLHDEFLRTARIDLGVDLPR